MRDILGNELALRDFIMLDSYTAGGHQMRPGIITKIDETKGKIFYSMAYINAQTGSTYYHNKHTTVMERVMILHPNFIPVSIAKGLWDEGAKYV